MIIKLPEDFDLDLIHESGQCFRWRKLEEYTDDHPSYAIIASGKVLRIKLVSDDNRYDVDCGQDEWDGFWHDYFDLDTDYAAVRNRISVSDDPFLFNASRNGKGIRILRQEPFETLITFIISQRKNIPAIRRAVEAICETAAIRADNDDRVFAFPGSGALLSLTDDELRACSLGYRAPYIRETTRIIESGKTNLKALESLSDERLIEALMTLPGVGIKVASCVALFAYGRLDLFPKDVWINRVLESEYKDGFPFERYAPYNGVMQQYLFHYRRSMPAAAQ